jgi:hypothetical protein
MTHDEALGMAWWNNASEQTRAFWLKATGTGVPADAWKAFKSGMPGESDAYRPEQLLRDAA